MTGMTSCWLVRGIHHHFGVQTIPRALLRNELVRAHADFRFICWFFKGYGMTVCDRMLSILIYFLIFLVLGKRSF